MGEATEVAMAGVADGRAVGGRVLMNDLGAKGRTARHLADADAIVDAIAPELRAGDVVAILSNGGFGNIYEKLPRALSGRQG